MANSETTSISFKETNSKILVDLNEFIPVLRATGFGLGSWAFSKENFETGEAKRNIKLTLSEIFGLIELKSEQAADLLIENSFSFSSEELDSLKKYGTNRLADKIYYKSKQLDYVIQTNGHPKFTVAASNGLIDESILGLCFALYNKGAYPLSSSGASMIIGSFNIRKTIISGMKVHEVIWNKPYVTFSCGLDIADWINTSIANDESLNFKWALEFKFVNNKKLSWTIELNDDRLQNNDTLPKPTIINLKQMLDEDISRLETLIGR